MNEEELGRALGRELSAGRPARVARRPPTSALGRLVDWDQVRELRGLAGFSDLQGDSSPASTGTRVFT